MMRTENRIYDKKNEKKIESKNSGHSACNPGSITWDLLGRVKIRWRIPFALL
jgi:hypothetical protein